MVDMINHPPHYTTHPSGVECIDIVETMSFNLGNAVKYIWRADLKNTPLENLRKAQWYLEREIERIEKSEEKDVIPVAQRFRPAESETIDEVLSSLRKNA